MPKRKKSTQELMGIETFSKYGLKANKSELAFFIVQPTNISVLSDTNIDMKIHNRYQFNVAFTKEQTQNLRHMVSCL